MSDNFHVSVRSGNLFHLETAISMIMQEHKYEAAKYYFIENYKENNIVSSSYNEVNFDYISSAPESKYLVLEWKSSGSRSQRLPFELKSTKVIAEFIKGWLETVQYPEKPDIDGDCTKGFFITTGNIWGFSFNSRYSLFSVAPDWQWHGK